MRTVTLALGLALSTAAAARPQPRDTSSLVVDLGYAQYEGYFNETAQLNIWKGIRYAEAGRWQSPNYPAASQGLLQATELGPPCPQSAASGSGVGFSLRPASEDCLILNVWAPPKAENLPVFLWIHGGGYGVGDGDQNFDRILNDNGNNFVAIAIQYRLGAFGFLSSKEVFEQGEVNAGLLDQQFSFQWAQKYIHQFGGDPNRVTIVGESAGAGSIIHHSLTPHKSCGGALFHKAIASSPFIPALYRYDSPDSTNKYNAFVAAAGCSTAADTYTCLKAADFAALETASNNVSTSGLLGTWAFYPVIGDDYIPVSPWDSLSNPATKFSGEVILVGNNAVEGVLFVPQNITTEEQLQDWARLNLPELDEEAINGVLEQYPLPADFDPGTPRYETTGFDEPNSISVSGVAVGQQQRANQIFGEATFVCPAYWIADLFAAEKTHAYRYQYSVPIALHGLDLTSTFGLTLSNYFDTGPNQPPDFNRAFRQIWGNFATRDNSDPSVSDEVAQGDGAGDRQEWASATTIAPWSEESATLLNLNTTGGVPVVVNLGVANATLSIPPGIRNVFTSIEDAGKTWDGGRRSRCDFWLQTRQRLLSVA